VVQELLQAQNSFILTSFPASLRQLERSSKAMGSSGKSKTLPSQHCRVHNVIIPKLYLIK